MAYTKPPKPTSTPYAPIYFNGKQIYDQSNITYDDSTIFYDGFNPSQYVNIPKPTGTFFIPAGTATGLIMPPTYSHEIQVNDPYTYISKPN